ncbi:MAG TPA: hypothetical protein VGF37_04445 [Chthoniobacterales bacterium]|jgi:hypothetical protein
MSARIFCADFCQFLRGCGALALCVPGAPIQALDLVGENSIRWRLMGASIGSGNQAKSAKKCRD